MSLHPIDMRSVIQDTLAMRVYIGSSFKLYCNPLVCNQSCTSIKGDLSEKLSSDLTHPRQHYNAHPYFPLKLLFFKIYTRARDCCNQYSGIGFAITLNRS